MTTLPPVNHFKRGCRCARRCNQRAAARNGTTPGSGGTNPPWQPRHDFSTGLAATVDWYLQNQEWCRSVRQRAGYSGERIGTRA